MSYILALGAIITMLLTGPAPAPAVYLIPHQDDDVLTFGADMKNHELAGRRTIAVLLTDGSSSGICDVNRDGIKTPVERTACTTQRDAEFKASMEALGVEPVIHPARVVDGTLTPAFVRTVITEYITLYGSDVSIKGQTYKESLFAEGHPDHDAIGEAMRQSYKEGEHIDFRLFIKPNLWDNVGTSYEVDRRLTNAALHAYGPDAPDAGTIVEPGVGHRSTATFCEQYGNFQADLPTLPNGKKCPLPNYNNSGADSLYHLPGQ